jgi:hypothetical protein
MNEATLVRLDEYREAESGAKVLDDVCSFLGRFVAYPSEHAQIAHTLWIAHTHLMVAWDSTPRIAFLSAEPESGKTRALEVTELLVPRPVEAVNVSPAYLFRKVASEDGLPTILYDEVDTVFGPRAKENEEIRGLLNAGHRRGAVAGRCVVRGKIVETEELPAFCAVALAGIGDLPETVLTRSVIIRMRRRAPTQNVEPWRRRVQLHIGEELHSRLAAWAATVLEEATNNWADMPEGVSDRAADVWEALLGVADAAGGDWPKRARVTAVTLVTASKGDRDSLGIRLLGDLKTIFGNEDQKPTEVILGRLHALPESCWNDFKGKPLTDRGLADLLRGYEIKSKTLRIDSFGTAKGYARRDFVDAWSRYLPPSPDGSVTRVTSVTEGAA